MRSHLGERKKISCLQFIGSRMVGRYGEDIHCMNTVVPKLFDIPLNSMYHSTINTVIYANELQKT